MKLYRLHTHLRDWYFSCENFKEAAVHFDIIMINQHLTYELIELVQTDFIGVKGDTK